MIEREGIEVVTERDGVRVVMPVVPPAFWFRAPELGQRVGAWFMGLFGLTMGVGGSFSAIELAIKMQRFLPVNNAMDLFFLVMNVVVVLLLAGMIVFIMVIVGIGFFSQRVVVEVNEREVMERWRCGPFWRRQRFPVEEIEHIRVRVPETVSERELAKPVEERKSRLWVVGMEGEGWRLRCSYPHGIAKAAGKALAEYVGKIIGKRNLLDDELDAEKSNENTENASEKDEIVVEEIAEGRQFYCRPGKLRDVWKMPVFRAGLWALVLGIGCFYLVDFFPNPLGNMRGLGWIMLLMGGGQGFLLMGLIVWGQMRWMSYEISAEKLIRRTHGFPRRSREWERSEIAALGMSERVGDEGRHRDVIEMLLTTGNRVEIASGKRMYLRRLATLLRSELGVGAEAQVKRLDPTDPLWHLEEEAEKPAGCLLTVEENKNGVAISKAAEGFGRLQILGFVFFVAMVVGSVVLSVVAGPRVKPDELGAVVMISVMFGGLGVLGILAVMYEQTMRFVVVVTHEAVVFTRESCFGQVAKQWKREELRGIRTEANYPQNPKTGVRVVLVKVEGVEKLVSGKAHEYRYLATVLRRATGLGW